MLKKMVLFFFLTTSILFGQEINELLSRAEKGDAKAQYLVGIYYSDGREISPDFKEAYKWYEKAAKQGMPEAQCAMGTRYFMGVGVEIDYSEAFKWHQLAANQNYAPSETMLGMMYLYGSGLPKNPSIAFNWFERAANKGDALSQTFLGVLYFRGEGVSKDLVSAYKWLTLASTKSPEAEETKKTVGSEMSPKQIEEALELARGWNAQKQGTTLTIFWIILVIAGLLGIGTFVFSKKSDPRDRAVEAAGAIAGGAMFGVGCLLQAILSAIPIAIAVLIVLWLLKGGA